MGGIFNRLYLRGVVGGGARTTRNDFIRLRGGPRLRLPCHRQYFGGRHVECVVGSTRKDQHMLEQALFSRMNTNRKNQHSL
jgi:hypothetical protein